MASAIETNLNDRLKAAMREKNTRVLDVVRAIKSKIGYAKTAEGFSGEVDDALYLQVIASYVKAMSKARDEYLAVGPAGAAQAEQLAFEVEYLSEFLPKKLGEAETRALVEQGIAETGVTSKKQIGKLMGTLMKAHKDAVDPDLVRRIAESILPA